MSTNILQANILHQQKSGVFLGYISKFPSICAQGNSIDEVLGKLSTFAKLYFDFKSNQDFEIIENNQEISF